MKRIGALVIGQSPRSDLVDPLRISLPHLEICECGALDRFTTAGALEKQEYHYPLSTRLRDGSYVIVEEADVAARLQGSLNRLEANDAAASILLCAAPFSSLKGTRPLIKPFTAAVSLLRSLGLQQLLIVCPFADQHDASFQKWTTAGFSVEVLTDPGDPMLTSEMTAALQRSPQAQAVVLDYVGYPEHRAKQLQQSCRLPVMDLGMLSITMLTALYA